MLLLTLDGILLLFITLGLGVLFKTGLEKLFRTPLHAGLLELFLTGLVFSTIYFNLVSYGRPVNYTCLLPLIAGLLLFFGLNRQRYRQLVLLIRERAGVVFSGPGAFFGICLLLLLCAYFIKPPGNPDSATYHYLSIFWYEKYKVVPGLANLQGRFAFNPASFIIQAAYSFTDLTGSSLYPLNGVTTGLFLFWLLARVLRHLHTYAGLVYLLLLAMLGRETLGNMSSPSSDLLMLVCTVYSLLRFFELIHSNEITPGKLVIPMVVALYAPVAKLSAFPLLAILAFMLYRLPGRHTKLLLAGKLFLTAALIYIPWLGRNVIQSGYLLYPFPYIDLFHVDWKAPKEVLLVDYYNAKYSPIFGSALLTFHQKPSAPFHAWFLTWFRYIYTHLPLVFLMVVAAFCSPLLWVFLYMRKRKPDAVSLIFYLLVYAGVWLWVVTSPDARFGMAFISMSVILPLLAATENHRKIPAVVLPALFTCFTVYYLYADYLFFGYDRRRRTHAVNEKSAWIYPLQHPAYKPYPPKPLPYTILNTGVKLYFDIPGQLCDNTCLPCMSWRYGAIEMRGPSLSDGFRNTRNDVKKAFPFIRETP